MRISDWSSDVCSSDLPHQRDRELDRDRRFEVAAREPAPQQGHDRREDHDRQRVEILRLRRRQREQPEHAEFGVAIGEQGEARSRSEEHTYELQSLMRISYAVFCLKKKSIQKKHTEHNNTKWNN